MARKDHVSETPATAFLKAHGVEFTEHPYEYLEHGGAQHSAKVLGFDPFTVVKTLVMQDEKAKPLIVPAMVSPRILLVSLACDAQSASWTRCEKYSYCILGALGY